MDFFVYVCVCFHKCVTMGGEWDGTNMIIMTRRKSRAVLCRIDVLNIQSALLLCQLVFLTSVTFSGHS